MPLPSGNAIAVEADKNGLDALAFSPVTTSASHHSGPRYQVHQATLRCGKELKVLPSPGSEGGRTKKKWNTVKLIIGDKNVAEAQAHAQPHTYKAHAIAASPALRMPTLRVPSHEKDVSFARDAIKPDSAESPLPRPARLDRHKWVHNGRNTHNDPHVDVRARRSYSSLRAYDETGGTSTTQDLNVHFPLHLQQKIKAPSMPRSVFTTSSQPVRLSPQQKTQGYKLADSAADGGIFQEDTSCLPYVDQSWSETECINGTRPAADLRTPSTPPNHDALRRHSFGTIGSSSTTSNSKASTIDLFRGELLSSYSEKQLVLEDAGNQFDGAISRSSTPWPSIPPSSSNSQKTLPVVVCDESSVSDFSLLHASTSSKEDSVLLDKGSFTGEKTKVLRCRHCDAVFTTRSPVAYCTGCGQSSGLHVHPTTDHGIAESLIRTTLQTTVEEEQASEFLTLSRIPRASRSKCSSMTLDHALSVLGLHRFDSVDYATLSKRLDQRLDHPWALEDPNEIVNAFAAVVRHQGGIWNSRLRWTPWLDSNLSNHLAFHGNWKSAARALDTSEDDCRKRWEQIKSKVDDLKQVQDPKDLGSFSCVNDTSSLVQQGAANTVDTLDERVDTPVSWTEKQDQSLIALKAENNSWAWIAEVLVKEQSDCKQRFKKIKPKDWQPNRKGLKTSAGRDMTKKKTTASSVSNKKLEGAPVSTLDAGGWDTPSAWAPQLNDADRYIDSGCDCIEPWGGNKADRGAWVFGSGDTKVAGFQADDDCCNLGTAQCPRCEYPADSPQCCGWGADLDWGSTNAWNAASVRYPGCDQSKQTYSSTASGGPSHHITAFKPCAVTYWATIGSGGKEIHIPIDCKHVSGPEKSIVSVDVPKVWKWVHDKGLGDKVGLQEAFDLARSIREPEIEDAKVEQPSQFCAWSY
ncbi:hypothetical protein SVAN01_01020 [Stagonosporopsis vannaccii]|nr:hypothetical protein SVAN01_01020 [Stagonosporopsis vannaccii]